ncbi:MAG: hypothetical protein WC542_05860 [Paludibacter sp.]
MKAIEINTKTDKNGHLKLNYALNKKNRNVRVLILVDENNDEIDEEKKWLDAVSSNPAFNFLNEPSENVYSLSDGEPLDD